MDAFKKNMSQLFPELLIFHKLFNAAFSGAQAFCIEWWTTVNNEFRKMYKKAVMTYFRTF
jgi:hypothetical protein